MLDSDANIKAQKSQLESKFDIAASETIMLGESQRPQYN